jgi:hypothetical protein
VKEVVEWAMKPEVKAEGPSTDQPDSSLATLVRAALVSLASLPWREAEASWIWMIWDVQTWGRWADREVVDRHWDLDEQ